MHNQGNRGYKRILPEMQLSQPGTGQQDGKVFIMKRFLLRTLILVFGLIIVILMFAAEKLDGFEEEE